MHSMFFCIGGAKLEYNRRGNIKYFNLGDKFDTRNVTDMRYMFSNDNSKPEEPKKEEPKNINALVITLSVIGSILVLSAIGALTYTIIKKRRMRA